MASLVTDPAARQAVRMLSSPVSLSGSRFRFPLVHATLFVVCSTMLRAILLLRFGKDAQHSAWQVAAMFGAGFFADVVVAACVFAPCLAWVSLARDQWFSQRWWRVIHFGGTVFWWFLALFLFGAEYFFFGEYLARFNTVAIDYLHYWTEVAGNIGEMYPVKTMVGVAALGSVGMTWLAWKLAPLRAGVRPAMRVTGFAGWCTVMVSLVFTFKTAGLRIGSERVMNELASNGLASGTVALVTRDLEYAAFFPTTNRDTAFARARDAVMLPGEVYSGPTDSLQRHVPGDAARPRLNVIVLVEESFGSEFWGCMTGREGKNSLTPCLDRIARDEGMLFTHIYADGNRTIRGLEAVLASFPPLPGDSILDRPHTQGCETLAQVLRRDGYSTTFVYPGNGWFDGMRDFALNNGWERFIERKDYPHVEFETIWGASNEDLYTRVLDEARAEHAAEHPFFLCSMSVTNHQPFTYPAGRIAESPKQKKRKNAVKYVDWALGQFFEQAKKEPFWKNTIFVVVADHGARVYGAQTIPIHSYEIPLLVVGPAVVSQPDRIDTLGCQLDVAPTVLGLIGRPYESTFYGHDLLRTPPERARALLNNNRSVGIYRDGRLVTFSLNKVIEAYSGDIRARKFELMPELDKRAVALADEATAIFQTADDLYMNHHYALNAPATGSQNREAGRHQRAPSSIPASSPR